MAVKYFEVFMKTYVKVSVSVAAIVLGLSFSIHAKAGESLKLPVMENAGDISEDVAHAVRVEERDKAAGTTTASINDVGAKKKKITVGFMSENALVAGQSNYNTFGSTNNVNASYDLGKERSIQVRQYFLYNMTNQDYPYEWTVGDTALQYSDAGHKIGSADGLFMARLYAPVNYYSQQVGKYELRLYEFVTQAAGKYVNLTYFLGPRFYAYTQNDASQTGFQVLPGITATYASETAFATPFVTVYMQDQWYNTGSGVQLLYNGVAGTYKTNAVNQDYLNVDLGTNLKISKNTSATLFYEYTNNVRQLNDSQPIDNPNSSWNLWFSSSM
jgi:hypothetical protein